MSAYALRTKNVETPQIVSKASGYAVAVIAPHKGGFQAIGFFGEVYGQGATLIETAKAAIKDPRLGTIPAGAAR